MLVFWRHEHHGDPFATPFAGRRSANGVPWLLDGVSTSVLLNRSDTNPVRVAMVCFSAHMLPQIPYMLPHVATDTIPFATCCHEGWLWEVAALLR